ncbi:PHP domain-containing protein [Umezawaea sp. Da 62-37]|uniref:PHP domain-containing protein n=1 Tax=Umezawaea sp. Da 62-37 TaxID=3075927 RepID=UPI0028F6E5AF|nr:PHP domain-containing protein [Umezawaea sp. Da 62-37]WNV87062.1 PHP domain-containing protein [Umezawaea sp. Da 62-37]
MLPADGHVHSEWSWEAGEGSMRLACARAVDLGLPAISFTEHGDLTTWTVGSGLVPRLPECFRARLGADGLLRPPDLDVPGYLDAVRRCRELFPGLVIRTGVELSEPHWHADRVADLLAGGDFERVLGSVHSIRTPEGDVMVDELLTTRPADETVRAYLAEVLRMVESCDAFQVLAHLDYPVRSWPASAGPYDARAHEVEVRAVLRALADSGRALEVNTTAPSDGEVVGWWREEGGTAVSFGSDAHAPAKVARRFAETAELVRGKGFEPGPSDFWVRVD